MKSRFESIVDQFVIFRHGLPEDVLCDKRLSLPLSPLVRQKRLLAFSGVLCESAFSLFLNALQPVLIGKLSLSLFCSQTLCLFKFSAVLFGSLLLFLLHGSYLVTGRLEFCL